MISLVRFLYTTLRSISTVPQTTRGRFFQLVHVEPVAVTNPDVDWITTTLMPPVEANLDSKNAFSNGWMAAIHPTRRIRTTVVHCNTRGWHLLASMPVESIPTRGQGFVTFKLLFAVSYGSVTVIYKVVVWAFLKDKYERKKTPVIWCIQLMRWSGIGSISI